VLTEILVAETKPRPLAVVCVTTELSKWPGQFRHSLDKMYAAVKAGYVRQSGQNVMVYRSREDGRVDIECGIEIDGRFNPIGDVVYRKTPSGLAVTAAHVDPYQELRASHDAIAAWSRKNGRKLTGTCWEIYGDWKDDPAQLRTDIFHLVRP
jgi:effector-binding domain-containing protein